MFATLSQKPERGKQGEERRERSAQGEAEQPLVEFLPVIVYVRASRAECDHFEGKDSREQDRRRDLHAARDNKESGKHQLFRCICRLTNMKTEAPLRDVRIDRDHTPDHLVGSGSEFRQRNNQERGIGAIQMPIPFIYFFPGGIKTWILLKAGSIFSVNRILTSLGGACSVLPAPGSACWRKACASRRARRPAP